MMPLIQVPLLSEHSFNLVRNRLLETIFGGITFFFNPDIRVSKWALVIQLGIHQMPFILGAVFTALVESKMCSPVVSSCMCGVFVTLFTSILHLTCLFWTNKSHYQHHVELTEVDLPSADKIKMGSLDLTNSEQSSDHMSMEDLMVLLFPKKRWKINYVFHPVCNGLLCGYAVTYLLPTTLNLLYRQAIISYAIFFVGWQTICVTAFSLTAHPPPETATFTVLDPYELKPLMRPFYVGLCYIVDLVCRLNFTLDSIPNAAVHLLLTFIPLMWFLNVFPPLDALLIWFLEQIQVWFAGGSPFSSKNFLGLSLQLLIWSGIVCGVYFLPKQITLLIGAVIGYVFSLDLVTIWRSLKCGKNKCSAWDIFDLVFFAALLTGVTFLSIVMYFLITPNSFQVTDTVIFAFGIVLLILYLVIVITSSSQRVYFLFGCVRNCIFPKNLQACTSLRQLQLHTLSRIRSAVVMIVTPLVLIVFITLMENFKNGEKYSKLFWINLLRIVAILRAFRWTWQQTESALFEVLISFFILRYTKLLNFIGSPSVVYLLMSVVVDRVLSVKSKCNLVCLLLVTSIIQEKQRRPYSCLLFVLNVAFYPLVLTLIFVAAILSAPLLALYTLPIFWIGFPRPTSFWPKQERDANDYAPDSIYYEEVVPNLTKALSVTFSSGVLGNVKTGDHFILRYESRLIWLTIAEHGFGYYNVMLKGLELQQTSCHAMEATTVDEILDWAFEVEDPSCRINRNPFHVFSPKVSMLVETYVDSRNVLTGVIDSPETLQMISNYFPKCLIWALLKCYKPKKDLYKVKKLSLNLEKQMVSDNSTEKKETKFEEFRKSSTSILVKEFEDDDDDPWKDENDLLGSPPPSTEKKNKSKNLLFNDLMIWADLEMNNSQSENISGDNGISQIDAQDISKLPIGKSSENVFCLSEEEMRASCFPNEWLKTPLSPDIFKSIQTEFPSHWFQFAFNNCSEIADDYKLTDCELKVYQHLVLSCHYIVNQLVVLPDRRVTSSIHPSAVNRIFHGELPWSALSEWLTQNAPLFKLVVLSFRYAFKLALDHILLNDIENESDLKIKLNEFERSWYIGPKEDPEWTFSIRKHVPNLFTLSFNSEKYIYSSHLLTRRNIPIYIGSLNRDAVNTIWTTLNLELLYLANDDEERYSIQAHSSLLRNLTIQAADPPLGYPIYMTKPILVKAIPTLLILCR